MRVRATGPAVVSFPDLLGDGTRGRSRVEGCAAPFVPPLPSFALLLFSWSERPTEEGSGLKERILKFINIWR